MSVQEQFSGEEEISHSDSHSFGKESEKKNGIAVAGLTVAVIALVLCIFTLANIRGEMTGMLANGIFTICHSSACAALVEGEGSFVIAFFIAFLTYLLAGLMTVVAFVLGVIAFVRSRRAHMGGKGFAIATIVISVVCLIAFIVCTVSYREIFSVLNRSVYINF